MPFPIFCHLRAIWFERYGNSVLLLVLHHYLSTLLCLLVPIVLPKYLLWVAWLHSGLSNRSNRNRLFALCVRPVCYGSCRWSLLKSLLLVCPVTLCVLPHPLSIFLWCSYPLIFSYWISVWFFCLDFFYLNLFGNERRCWSFVSLFLPFSMLYFFISDIFFIRLKSRSMLCFVSRA